MATPAFMRHLRYLYTCAVFHAMYVTILAYQCNILPYVHTCAYRHAGSYICICMYCPKRKTPGLTLRLLIGHGVSGYSKLQYVNTDTYGIINN